MHPGCAMKHTITVIHDVVSHGVEESVAFVSPSITCCPERACRTLIKILAKVDQEINTHETTVQFDPASSVYIVVWSELLVS